MSFNRRDFLKISALSVGATLLGDKPASAEKVDDELSDNYAMLNDCTKCIGCRACQSACKQSHGLENTGDDPRYDMPLDLNAKNLTIIQSFYESESKKSFIKRQCLHCNIPSCASVCPVSAMKKRDDGVVAYDKDKCIGCRYCLVACPFNAPTFEYEKAVPQIQKCDFCKDIRLSKGLPPVCADTCPRGAIKFGKRGDLLAEAKNRIKENPELYNSHIYGETEIGGTSVMYLAPKGISFEELGYKNYEEVPPFKIAEDIQHGIFKYWIPPVALFGALGFAAYKTGQKDNNSEEGK